MKPLLPWRYRPGYQIGAGHGKTSKSQNPAAQRGIAYHKRVYRQLQEQYPDILIEPWFVQVDTQPTSTMRSPDAVLRLEEGLALVIEVKMNWKDGRDRKLIDEYLPVVSSAFELPTCPLLITACLRGYQHPPLLGLQQVEDALAWQPGDPTPLLLLP